MFVILNPHVSDFYYEPISYRIIKRRALKKYNYIFDSAGSEKINILVDGSGTGMLPTGLFLAIPLLLRILICRIEISWWLRINGLKGKVNVYYRKENLEPSSVLFSFAYKLFRAKDNLVKTASYFSHSIFHLSHYHGFTAEISSTLSKIPNCRLAADADVSGSPFFKNYFSWYKQPVLIVPFEVAKRFQSAVLLSQRKRKAIALGTFHRFDEGSTKREQKILKEYVSFTGANELHPLRRQIFDNPELCKPYIDSMISPYIEKKTNFLSKIFKTFFSQQKKYFSFDIVQKYNEYVFAIVGEELHNGLPGIGSFEAMGCGCILIGNESCYHGLHMTGNVHYIAYNGNLNELLATLKEIVNLPGEELEKISTCAIKYIEENFTRDRLCKRFDQTITGIPGL